MKRADILKIAKPILFNTDMVRATLEDRKSVTRRVAKGITREDDKSEYYNLFRKGEWTGLIHRDEVIATYAPYHKGDYLYVRETWSWCPCWDCGMVTEEHGCCDETASRIYNQTKREYGCYDYRASCEDNKFPNIDTWHPSIHMPKEAARIFLRVTDVRLERLQYIDNKEAKLEGVTVETDNSGQMHRFAFYKLWDSTIPKKDLNKYGYKANPWVWVIEFERVEVKD